MLAFLGMIFAIVFEALSSFCKAMLILVKYDIFGSSDLHTRLMERSYINQCQHRICDTFHLLSIN